MPVFYSFVCGDYPAPSGRDVRALAAVLALVRDTNWRLTYLLTCLLKPATHEPRCRAGMHESHDSSQMSPQWRRQLFVSEDRRQGGKARVRGAHFFHFVPSLPLPVVTFRLSCSILYGTESTKVELHFVCILSSLAKAFGEHYKQPWRVRVEPGRQMHVDSFCGKRSRPIFRLIIHFTWQWLF